MSITRCAARKGIRQANRLPIETIITSFPRRWGKIRPDSSDVHEAIRRRLKEAGSSDIKSAYDIAPMVIDECSRVFFDRALDRRPKLIDIFADAISCMVSVSGHKGGTI